PHLRSLHDALPIWSACALLDRSPFRPRDGEAMSAERSAAQLPRVCPGEEQLELCGCGPILMDRSQYVRASADGHSSGSVLSVHATLPGLTHECPARQKRRRRSRNRCPQLPVIWDHVPALELPPTLSICSQPRDLIWIECSPEGSKVED